MVKMAKRTCLHHVAFYGLDILPPARGRLD
jgi:hypothetical protein